jgi:hypothetical protein
VPRQHHNARRTSTRDENGSEQRKWLKGIGAGAGGIAAKQRYNAEKSYPAW